MGMPGTLEGRVVVVTGGLGHLGRAVCLELQDRGAIAVPMDLPPSDSAGGAASSFIAVDLSDPAAAGAAFAQAKARHGRLDGLVNVAGGFAWETVADGAVETWDRMFSMNLRTAVVASRAALPALLDASGRIVNVGALASLQAGAGMGAYAASKSGVARLTEALAEEMKDRGITVNAVLPSIIDTLANRAAMPDAEADRWVTARALSRVIAFLLSDDAAAITGALLPVRGRV